MATAGSETPPAGLRDDPPDKRFASTFLPRFRDGHMGDYLEVGVALQVTNLVGTRDYDEAADRFVARPPEVDTDDAQEFEKLCRLAGDPSVADEHVRDGLAALAVRRRRRYEREEATAQPPELVASARTARASRFIRPAARRTPGARRRPRVAAARRSPATARAPDDPDPPVAPALIARTARPIYLFRAEGAS